jgi:protein involved in ribonucleotide reduction
MKPTKQLLDLKLLMEKGNVKHFVEYLKTHYASLTKDHLLQLYKESIEVQKSDITLILIYIHGIDKNILSESVNYNINYFFNKENHQEICDILSNAFRDNHHIFSQISKQILAIEYLLNVNSIDTKFIDGNTYLHKAIIANNFDFVEILLLRGADINIKNDDGMTGLELAEHHQCHDIIYIIQRYKTLEDARKEKLEQERREKEVVAKQEDIPLSSHEAAPNNMRQGAAVASDGRISLGLSRKKVSWVDQVQQIRTDQPAAAGRRSM